MYLITLKNEEMNSKPKYIIKIILDSVLDTEIYGYDKVKQEEGFEDESACYDYLKRRESIISIKDRLTEQYIVDEKPIRNEYTVCFKIASKENTDGYMSMKPSINKGETICR